MTDSAGERPEQPLVFGPFRLFRLRKQLFEGDKPVRLGSRAFDLLTALVERAGEVVSREELEACVWPRTIVEETSLRAHVSALRKALGDGHQGARFITNVPGRGYCFVAPVQRAQVPQASHAEETAPRSHNLPVRLTSMIGRAEAVAALTALVPLRRFVTIAGSGGIGKTTLALAAAEELLGSFPDGVRFVDFAPVVDPQWLPTTLATALQISVPVNDSLAALIAFLGDKKVLLVFDNCEHVIDAAAALAEGVLRRAAGVSVLATSREPLNAEGEWVYRLGPLEMPPTLGDLSAVEAMTFPAIELFVQRAMGTSDTFELSDESTPALCEVCRRLDGIPLAIELAAARVEALGVHGLAARLEDSLQLLTRGRRTASPRHRTLAAMLDWSYALLSPNEQRVFERLAPFKSAFTLEAAIAVAADEEIDATEVIECVMNLAAKSLLSTDAGTDVIRYRSLDVTRAYAVERLMQRNDASHVFKRHAEHLRDLTARAESDWDTMDREQWMALYGPAIDDIRAALEWCFSNDGDPALGAALTAAAVQLVYELGLLDEFHEIIERALSQVHLLSPPQPLLELRLTTALGFRSGLRSSASTRQGFAQPVMFARALELSSQLSEPRYEIMAQYSRWVGAFGTGDYPTACAAAERVHELARRVVDPPAILLSDRLLAQARHFLGDHASARTLAERVMRHPSIHMPPGYTTPVPRAVSMRILLSRILWLEGWPDQAAKMAAECVDIAANAGPIPLTQSLGVAACPIALWRGDDAAARALVARLKTVAVDNASDYWASWARSFEVALECRRLQAAPDAGSLDAIEGLFAHTTNAKEFDCMATLIEGWVDGGTLARAANGVTGWCAPEILRARGEQLLRRDAEQAVAEAEAIFLRALELARRQGAVAWELRGAMSLLRLRQRHRAGDLAEANDLLTTVLSRFSEGLDTVDLAAARELSAST